MGVFTERDKQAARVIVSIFETSGKQGDPGRVAVLADGAGISYGIHQATHRAGSLEAVLREFAARAPAHQGSALKWAEALSNRTANRIRELSRNTAFKDWLRQAGAASEMRAAQEAVFDRDYLAPAIRACEAASFVEPISLAIVYDAHIQGGWVRCRDYTNARHTGPVGERRWIEDYLEERVEYLSGLKTQDQRNSVYRPKAFQQLLRSGNWSLTTPFTVRGLQVTDADLI